MICVVLRKLKWISLIYSLIYTSSLSIFFFFYLFSFFIIHGCGGEGKNSQSKSSEPLVWEREYGEGLFPVISPCLGKTETFCVYFSEPSGAIRFAPLSPEPSTSTYAYIPSEDHRAIPVIFSPSLTSIIEVQGDVFSNYRVMNVWGEVNSADFVSFAFGKYLTQGASAIVFFSPDRSMHIIALIDKIKRVLKVPGFFNNYLDIRRKEIRSSEIIDAPGSCVDIYLVGRLLLISNFSAGFKGVKFLSYDVISDKILKKEIVGWTYSEISTYPTTFEPGFYLLGLSEPAFPASEVSRVIPAVPFGFLDENTIWIKADEPQNTYRIIYVKRGGDFLDSCSTLWWKNNPAVFVVSGNKLKVASRLSDWNWTFYDIDENVFGDISAVYTKNMPCVAYSKVKGLFLSCSYNNEWKVFPVSKNICSFTRTYYDESSNLLYISCVSQHEGRFVVRAFSLNADALISKFSSPEK